MEEKKTKEKSSIRKLLLKVTCVILAFLVTAYLSLFIYLNFVSPPIVVDGKAGMMKYLKKAKEEKEKKVDELRSKVPENKDQKQGGE